MTLTKRGLMRLCTLSLAAVTALSVKSYKLMKKADAAERSVNNNYTAAVEELAHSCDSLIFCALLVQYPMLDMPTDRSGRRVTGPAHV